MNKSKRSFYTAITAIIYTLLTGLSGLIVTRTVLSTYGSDYNGLNSTVNQFVNVLLLVEGGFTLASSVALFKPITSKDNTTINGILSATRIKFNKIGLLFILIGTVGSLIYSNIIKTSISSSIVIIIFIMVIAASSFNLIFAAKYRILMQTEQREYVINGINIISLLFSQSFIMILATNEVHILWIRFVILTTSVITNYVISIVCKKKYSRYNFNSKPLFAEIKGTRDVFVQKITSVIYSTVPILFMSASVGTLYASVYFVYNSVIALVKNIIFSFTNAPRMSLGNLIAGGEKEHTKFVFLQYEFVVSFFMFGLLSATSVMIMPFISLYTKGVSDVNYGNNYIAVIVILIALFETVHIPSGNLINMAGYFHISRKIQTRASIFLTISLFVGNILLGLYGILIAVLITAIFLAVQEIYFVYHNYFPNSIPKFLKITGLSFLLSTVLVYFEITVVPIISSYTQFFLIGGLIFLTNATILFCFNLITNREITCALVIRVRKTILSKI